MIYETKKVLITVKAYPNPSKKYQETVCVAGIDIDSYKWIRLYPIPFRDLDDNKKFKKYSIIKVKTTKARDDHRPESYKVIADSIEIIDYLDSKTDKWKARKKYVIPTVSQSFCEIIEKRQTENKSLGVFKPKDVKFSYKKAKKIDKKDRANCYAQLSFLKKEKDAIEYIPYNFYYEFFCFNDINCKGHKLLIIDWEIGQAYRKWKLKYEPTNLLLENIKKRWLNQICSPSKDTFFYVGNMKRFPNNFLILGVFHPPL